MKRVLLIMLIATALVGVMLAPASTAVAASGTRSLPLLVAGGANFDVDINTVDYGTFGQAVETLPPGFSYVNSNLSAAAVTIEGQVVKFTLLGETAFSYTVTAASTAGSYTFSGILKDEDKVEYIVSGQTQVTVTATRSLPSSVAGGANFDVDINTADYGTFGQAVETLPPGFSYVNSTLSAAAVTIEGQVVKFTLLGETAFSYTVTAASTAGSYTFSGVLKDEDKVEYAIGGQTQITVPAPTGVGVSVGGGGGGSGRTAGPVVVTNIFGIEASFRISSQGEILETITATSADGNLTVTIPEGTIALDKDGEPLSSLTADVEPNPPDPPAGDNIIGLVYDFQPEGATFEPSMTCIFTYDPDELAAGDELVVMEWDENAAEWVELSKEDYTVDTETNTVTLSLSGFSKYAIFARALPPSPPAVAPASAAFSLSNLTVRPTEVQLRETVTISVSVANTGGTEGSYTVVLKLNGVKEAEKSLTIAAGSSEVVTFSATREEAGSYSVAVDGLSASFTVAAPAPALLISTGALPVQAPINWPLIGGIIAAVAAVALLIFFLVVRRRAY